MALLRRSCWLGVVLCLLASGAGQAGGRAHVYLMRGIFDLSVGLDALAGKLSRMGVEASVHGHAHAVTVAADALRDHRSGRIQSIILIGHSLGAGAAVAVARELDLAGIPVGLLIALDPVFMLAVSPNVRQAVDFYVAGSGLPISMDAGSRGSLRNVDLSGEPGIDHMTLQSTDRMHARMIGYVLGSIGRGRQTGRQNGSGCGVQAGGPRVGRATRGQPGSAVGRPFADLVPPPI